MTIPEAHRRFSGLWMAEVFDGWPLLPEDHTDLAAPAYMTCLAMLSRRMEEAETTADLIEMARQGAALTAAPEMLDEGEFNAVCEEVTGLLAGLYLDLED